jgi:N-carbamoyl-L-amino-acid hydrolase
MALARCGATALGGVNRQAFCSAEAEARALIAGWARDLNLETFVDEVGNFYIRRPGIEESAAPVMTGSHIDTVPAGGKFDGSYGVIAALEVLEALATRKAETVRPIEAVIWANEEGARFAPGQMGSAGFVGTRKVSDILSIVDRDGISVEEALGPILAVTPHATARSLGRPEIAAFIEAHIEQGPQLEAAGCTVGVVTGIQGRRSFVVDVRGEAAHGGTTRQSGRKDALLAAMQIIHELDLSTRDPEDMVRFTVGQLSVEPNAPLVVPARVRFTVDVRHPSNEIMERLGNDVHHAAQTKARGCAVEVTENARALSIFFANEVISLIEAAASNLGLKHQRIFSLAGHDSRELFKACPTGMIFVPCRRGVSHAEAEDAAPSDLAAGARVLAEVVVTLANREGAG